ncbi:hypothetical protein H1C71_007036 [Ictidomys tridecemlineatus]|nr:hypothetical protein H1C71_007036 [Ictidomys tridecemlineatus]
MASFSLLTPHLVPTPTTLRTSSFPKSHGHLQPHPIHLPQVLCYANCPMPRDLLFSWFLDDTFPWCPLSSLWPLYLPPAVSPGFSYGILWDLKFSSSSLSPEATSLARGPAPKLTISSLLK